MRVLVVSADRTEATGHPQNLGDALLTDTLVDSLRTRGHDARALDLGTADRRGGAPRIRASGARGLFRAAGGADAVILGGGTLFQDDQPGARFAGLPRLCAATAAAARVHRTGYAVYGVGVDPVARRRARAAIRVAARPGATWVRDAASVDRLEALTGHRPALGADAALLGADGVAVWGRSGTDRSGAVLALHRADARALTRAEVIELRERHGRVSFLSMDQGTDADAAALPGEVRDLVDGCDAPPRSWQEAAAEIGAAEVVIASRMHAMYLAAMTGTAVVAVARTPKTAAFTDEFALSTSQAARADPVALSTAVERARTSFEEVAGCLE